MLMMRALAILVAALLLAACTRADDGTVVPRYRAAVVQDGWVPRVAIERRARTAYPQGSQAFPEPPATEAPEMAGPPVRAASRRQRTERRPVRQPAGNAADLRCGSPTLVSGRYKVECR